METTRPGITPESTQPATTDCHLVFKPITLDSLHEIAPYLTRQSYRTCDFSIGGIYMWVGYFGYEYAICRDTLFIKGGEEDHLQNTAFAVPVGSLDLKDSLPLLGAYCRQHGLPFILSAVPEPAAQSIAELYGCPITELPDWGDYLYRATDLATLVGHRFNKKRNRVNKFKSTYPDFQYEAITPQNLPELIAFFDRYMQVARCFRDEDLRADRQPEFTQIDFEMSFVDQEDVMAIGEGFIQEAYKELCGVDIPLPLPRLTWDEAMRRFGSDKPDMRFGLELVDLSDALKNTEFKVFSGALAEGGSVRGICLKGEAEKLSRKEIDKLQEWIKAYGAKGLAWTRLAEKETSSYEKFLSPEECSAIRTAMGAQPGDVLFLVASDDNSVVFASLGALRCELAKRFGLIDTSKPCLLWVTDFPQFEYSKEEDRYVAMHHPFTAPRDEDVDKLTSDPGHVYAKAYDMVANGYELGGGSIRINDPDVQAKMFEALGFTPEQAQARFGFLLNAFRFGAPPHGGMAWGLERIMMVLLGTDNIRDVLAFPKVASSAELMSAAPGHVDPKQLEELGIAILPSAQKEEA